jgi:hypothetical protein
MECQRHYSRLPHLPTDRKELESFSTGNLWQPIKLLLRYGHDQPHHRLHRYCIAYSISDKASRITPEEGLCDRFVECWHRVSTLPRELGRGADITKNLGHHHLSTDSPSKLGVCRHDSLGCTSDYPFGSGAGGSNCTSMHTTLTTIGG